MTTGPQLRAARALIGVAVDEVAKAAQVSTNTIRRAEACPKETRLTAANLAAICHVYERVGVEFLNSEEAAGVRLHWETFEKIKERSKPKGGC
ncbi:helix-turn-helix domain-containing protein [Roseospira marina]|uniref:Helix-turn-helix domain-containing protein n=1 Tax=Roseospira marina TaxID=140057 RepID=A0A5M6IFC1_9PROT|nr:helix-turn-helix domain-containing protein [Roseospira marina]KAA5606832.1 helix-turn-helix domain-containing protein [Roseospira marina]MBB4313008.1 transcriptional regulator with XRE-family HTH domain [Roseospira marina]